MPASDPLQAGLPTEQEQRLDERALSKLRWRCRRGLLENDLFLERFFQVHEETLNNRQAAALGALMDLADNDLLDLFLARKEPTAGLDSDAIREVLTMVRSQPLFMNR